MTLEEEIKQFAHGRGAELVGIATVKEINKYAPAGHRPDDLLIGAKSVVVMANRWTPRGAWHSPGYSAHVENRSFGAPERKSITLAVANLIEEKYGYYSLIFDHLGVSQKLCAETAGLGTRSMAGGILLNKNIGPLMVATTITTMPFEGDGPLEEHVCPHSSCMKMWERRRITPCLETCPECLSGELENGRIKWMRYNQQLCSTRAQNRSVHSFQKLLLEAINEPDVEKRKTIVMGSFFTDVLHAISSGVIVGQCGECLRACPVVMRARTLRPKIKVKAAP